MGFAAIENPRTGEYGVLRRPSGTAGSATFAELYARPGAAVPYEHIHPAMTETFTVVRGLTVRIDGGRNRHRTTARGAAARTATERRG